MTKYPSETNTLFIFCGGKYGRLRDVVDRGEMEDRNRVWSQGGSKRGGVPKMSMTKRETSVEESEQVDRLGMSRVWSQLSRIRVPTEEVERTDPT